MIVSTKYESFRENCLYILNDQYKHVDIQHFLEQPKYKWHTHYSSDIDTNNQFIKDVIKRFKVNIIKARLNYFEQNMSKDFHKDNYKQDLTIVINIDPCDIIFKNDKTESTIKFKLEPLSIYVFDTVINNNWSHRVDNVMAPRYSIVLWCKHN